MELQITLAPDGGLQLVLPTGRKLNIGLGPSTLHFIRRILMDAQSGKREQRGYIGEFPTQHVLDIWKKQDEAAKAEAKKEEFLAKGIDLDALNFTL